LKKVHVRKASLLNEFRTKINFIHRINSKYGTDYTIDDADRIDEGEIKR
jgi:hypothetical protein